MKQFFQNLFNKQKQKEHTTETAKQCCAVEKTPAVDEFSIDPETFHELVGKKMQIKLIDVRRPEEYNEGHIGHAQLLPVQELSQERIDALGVKKDDEILLYCRSGGRSGKALEQFLQLGYKNVKHLNGGILAWQEKNLPLEK